jgi:peptidoglycan/LPS O-acetylase OafA/YrhL
MTKEKNSKKLPSLDGWRAVSIALVLLLHSSYAPGFLSRFHWPIMRFDAGDLGVRFFFVISGFLITFLLLQEHAKHDAISLKHFYMRRALRILPVYFFYLFVLGFLTRYSQAPSAWLANATFTTNFFGTPWSTGHLWSLGVEEQFYLLWPWFLVVVLNRQEGCSKLLKILIVPLFVAPLVRMINYELWYPVTLEFLFQRASFFARFDSLAYGCLAAILFVHWRKPLEIFYKKNFHLITWGGVRSF